MRRNIGLVAGSMGLVMLLTGALTMSWWTAQSFDATLNLGLKALKSCTGGICVEMAYDAYGTDDDRAFITLGSMVHTGTMVLSGVLGMALLLGTLRKRFPGPVSPARMVVLLSFVMGIMAIVFVMLRPELARYPMARSSLGVSIAADLSAGFSMPVYMAGVLLSMLGGHLLAPAPCRDRP